MAADRVLSSKPCSLQNADKNYTDGTFYVFSTLARFMARDGSGQKLEIGILDIKGAQGRQQGQQLMVAGEACRTGDRRGSWQRSVEIVSLGIIRGKLEVHQEDSLQRAAASRALSHGL
jgi:hypothetical protein